MTARASFYSFLLVALTAIPATVLVASNILWGVWFYALPVLALVLAPFLFSRWVPNFTVRRWIEKHDVEFTDDERKTLRHLAAHSGLPYTNALVVKEALQRESFYASRKNFEMMMYLQDPVFAHSEFRHRVWRLNGTRPDVEKLRKAVAAGATSEDIHRRWERSGAPLDAVAESFIDGIPDEYFLALSGGEN